MKVTPSGEKVILQFAGREKNLFCGLLRLYPCVPPSHRLQESGELPESSKRLLDDALAEQRTENKKQIDKFLSDARRFKESNLLSELTVTQSELEWLLQILNDVRVGSWITLGSPDETKEMQALNEKTAPHFWAMQVAGHFQMTILGAFSS